MKHNNINPSGYFDGYVITSLVISALAIMYLSAEFSSENIGYFFIGWLCISFAGAAALALNHPKLGGILLIIGSIPIAPAGLIGIWGGLRILKRQKEGQSTTMTGVAQKEFYSVIAGRFMIMGIIAIISGAILMSVHPNLGIFMAIGIVWIFLSYAQKNEPVVSLYAEHIRIKKSPVSTKTYFFSYTDIIETQLIKDGKELLIRFKSEEGSKSASLYAGWIGSDNLTQVAKALDK